MAYLTKLIYDVSGLVKINHTVNYNATRNGQGGRDYSDRDYFLSLDYLLSATYYY